MFITEPLTEAKGIASHQLSVGVESGHCELEEKGWMLGGEKGNKSVLCLYPQKNDCVGAHQNVNRVFSNF